MIKQIGNRNLAFSTAEKKWNVQRLLVDEDFGEKGPDKEAVITYLETLYGAVEAKGANGAVAKDGNQPLVCVI